MNDSKCVKLTRKWGGYKVGDVVRLGSTKADTVVKRKNRGGVVPEQRAVNDPPVVETAMVDPHTCRGLPETETAILNIQAKGDAKAKVKAKADADYKRHRRDAEDDYKSEAEREAQADEEKKSEILVNDDPEKKAKEKKKGGRHGRN